MRTPDQRMLDAVQRPEVYEEVVINSGGVPVVLSVWRAGPAAPAVLFLPGTMTHPLFYEEFLDALNLHDLTVVGLHPQAHGKSPRVRRPLTFRTLVRNGRDALRWMRAELPGAPLVVIGSSQGGVLALALASREDDLTAVFAHNVLDPDLPSSIGVTRFPRTWARAYQPVRTLTKAVAAAMPRLPVPFSAYLDMDRICRDRELVDMFYTDPLGRRSYPLEFMASLMHADLSGMRDGSITCPVRVIASSGDRLFTLDYTREVFAGIVAPDKRLLVIDSDKHLIFNEALDAVLPVLVPLIGQEGRRALANRPAASHAGPGG